MNIIYVFK